MNALRTFLIFVPLVYLPLVAEAQTVLTFDLTSVSRAEVSVKSLHASEPSVFDRVFKLATSPRLHQLKPASFVVTNNSKRAIIGIAVEWTFTDAAGNSKKYGSRTHSFLAVDQSPLALPGTTLFVAPSLFIPELAARTTGGLIGSLPEEAVSEQISSASAIRVEIDSIVFDDGEVVGPNRLQLPEDIQDRQAAADAIVKEILDAKAEGADPKKALVELSNRPLKVSSRARKYQSIFIEQLLQTKNFDALLQRLKDLAAAGFIKRGER
jgi:hypothetical protein